MLLPPAAKLTRGESLEEVEARMLERKADLGELLLDELDTLVIRRRAFGPRTNGLGIDDGDLSGVGVA